MNPCKRIEIVIEEAQAPRLADALEELECGYTMLPRASGNGDRGRRRADDPTGTFTNCVFIVASEDDALTQTILDTVKPLLDRFGGICLLSEATWLRH